MRRVLLILFSCFLVVACDKKEQLFEDQSEHRRIHLYLDAPILKSVNTGEAEGLIFDELGFHPNDSVRLKYYTLNIQDELNQRLITDSLDLEHTLEISIDSIQGSFQIHSSHNASDLNFIYPYYYLNAAYEASAEESSVDIVFNNKEFCFVSVKSDDFDLLNVSIEENPLFQISPGVYYAFLNVEEQPFTLTIETASGIIEEELTYLELDEQYLFEVNREQGMANLNLSYILGFQGEIIHKELNINPSNSLNLLNNGGFEKWVNNEIPEGYDLAENAYRDSLITKEGAYALRQSYGTSSLAQRVEITPSENYQISFYFQVLEGDGSDARLWGSFLDAELNAVQDIRNVGTTYFEAQPSDGIWHRYSAEYTAPENAHFMNFELRVYGEAVLVFDSIFIKKAQ